MSTPDPNVPAPAPAPQPAADPAPQPAPAQPQPAPYVPPAQPGPQYGGGGQPSGNMISRFFEGITIADVVITSLTLCALFLIIRHYRDKIITAKEEKDTLKAKVAEIETTVNNLVADIPPEK